MTGPRQRQWHHPRTPRTYPLWTAPWLILGASPLAILLACMLTLTSASAVHAEPAPTPPSDIPGGIPGDIPPVPEPDNQRPCRPLGKNDTLRLDAAELPLSDLVRIVSCALDRNLMVAPPSLGQGLITVFAPRPLTRQDLLNVWHTALAANDLLEERRGALYLIRPARTARPGSPAPPPR